jgi:hypothetical protein
MVFVDDLEGLRDYHSHGFLMGDKRLDGWPEALPKDSC